MGGVDGWVLSLHDDVPVEAARAVDEGLGTFNASAAPLHEVRALSCFARDASGRVVGGAVGRSWGLCCELQQLWVEPVSRGKGLGARILRAFEGRARERGCRTFYLETFSFQAPDFYRSQGYEVGLALHGMAPDVAKYIMVRQDVREVSDAPENG